MKMYVRKRCNKCNGSGDVDCKACGGSGYSWSGGQCGNCGGTGLQTCPKCNGDGYIEVEEEED